MGLDRRSFISLVTGGVVGSLFTPVVWKTLDDVSIWTQNWPWIPTLNYGTELSVDWKPIDNWTMLFHVNLNLMKEVRQALEEGRFAAFQQQFAADPARGV